MSGARMFRLGERVARPAADVIRDLRDPARWARALGGAWSADPPRWRWTQPRPGSCDVAWAELPHGVELQLTGPVVQGRIALTAVDADPGTSTVVADVSLSLAVVIPGAWWLELQREVGPRWLRALTAAAPAGTDRVDG